MFAAKKKICVPLLFQVFVGLIGLYAIALPAHAQNGYVSVTFSPTVVHPGQNITVGTDIDACVAANNFPGGVEIFVSTTEGGSVASLGHESGTGVTFNSIMEGNQGSAATYYFYAYYTSAGIINGQPDPCAQHVESPSPLWAALNVIPLQ